MANGAPNASDFLGLYAFERPPDAVPVQVFVEELKSLVRAHPMDTALAGALKYGGVDRDAIRRWIGDYWTFIRRDAQGTAATIARCRRRGLFIALSPLVNRKTGFLQVTRPPLELFLRFAAAFDLSQADLDAHWAAAETLQATATRLHFQFSSFEEGFVASALGAEGPLLDVVRDERPWLCQRGIAEYMKRAWNLDDDAVAYWRAYEDFRSFVTEPVWDVVQEIAVDGTSQQLVRTTLHHWLLVYQNMRRAWGEMVTGQYPVAPFVWPPPGARFGGDDQTHAQLEEELGEFCCALPRPTETAFGLLLSGRASREAVKELVRDFIHLDATRPIAGQFSRLDEGPALRAIAQAFATESGGYLTRNHMEIWADFAEQAFGITREEMFRWIRRRRRSRAATSRRGSSCTAFPRSRSRRSTWARRRPRRRRWGRRRWASARAASPARACSSSGAGATRSPTPSRASASIPIWRSTSSGCTARSSPSSRTRDGPTCHPSSPRRSSGGASSTPTSGRSFPSSGRTRGCCGG